MCEIVGYRKWIYRREEKYLSILFFNIYFVDKKWHVVDKLCCKTVYYATVKSNFKGIEFP